MVSEIRNCYDYHSQPAHNQMDDANELMNK